MKTQKEKGERFRALHERKQAFLIPNPWDVGTAVVLEKLGFEALATTSAGFAFSLGQEDNKVDLRLLMQHVTALAAASDLPVSVDLGNGFGNEPETVEETIRLTAAAGAVGGSVEDYTGEESRPFYGHEQAAERVRAAAEAGRSLPFPFMLTARAENYLYGKPDLSDTIRRLQRYQEAGADVLYAPGITTREQIVEVVRAVDRPVNVLVGLPGLTLNLQELSEIGVRRVSVGSGLCRAAMGAFVQAAREMREKGTFTWTTQAVPSIGGLLK
ncbi:MAG TPA: isocitrate lyase/phosphoenolpyruvate mutase family protein [Verrucomicrobiae bacterium]|nr:isocitrate lyase/phosphoenolpyruvate mutase family protein [Verrucomicrobiae bacterium]